MSENTSRRNCILRAAMWILILAGAGFALSGFLWLRQRDYSVGLLLIAAALFTFDAGLLVFRVRLGHHEESEEQDYFGSLSLTKIMWSIAVIASIIAMLSSVPFHIDLAKNVSHAIVILLAVVCVIVFIMRRRRENKQYAESS